MSIPAESPFLKYLDYAPSPNDALQIRTLVGQQQQVVDRIDRELVALTKRRELYSRNIVEHMALLSPIRQLPIDVLGRIFILCRPREEEVSAGRRRTLMTRRDPSVVLSHVCQQWRRLALGLPLMWSTISIIYPPNYPAYSEVSRGELSGNEYSQRVDDWEAAVKRRTEIADQWIQRSGQCPLTVVLRCHWDEVDEYDTFPETYMDVLEDYIDVLCASSARWKEVDLSFWVSPFHHSYLRLAHHSASSIPQLESVLLTLAFHDGEDVDQTMQDIRTGLLEVPRLRKLHLKSLWADFPAMAIHWDSLTELSIGGSLHGGSLAQARWKVFDRPKALTLLKQCPNLIQCTLILEQGHNDHDMQVRKITVPRLAALSIVIEGPPANTLFPESLNLPSLRTLSLRVSPRSKMARPSHPERGAVDEYVAWMVGFGRQLTAVTMDLSYYFRFSPEKLKLDEYLEGMPNLVSLDIADHIGALVHPIIERLTPRYSSTHVDDHDRGLARPCLCPKLRSFRIVCDYRGPLNWICDYGHYIEDLDQDRSVDVNEVASLWRAAAVEFLVARRTAPTNPRVKNSVAPLEEARIIYPELIKPTDFRSKLEERGVSMDGWVLKLS